MSNNKMTRKEFLNWMLRTTGYGLMAPYLGGMDSLLAQAAPYKYFIGIFLPTLAQLKSPSSHSYQGQLLHGGFFQGYGNWDINKGSGSIGAMGALKSHLVVPRGLTANVGAIETTGHFQAHGAFLTGYPHRGAANYDRLLGNSRNEAAPAHVKSIDWMIAQHFNTEPIALGYNYKSGFNGSESPAFFNTCSWRDPNNAFYPVFDSKALHNQLKSKARCSTYVTDTSQIQSQIQTLRTKKKVLQRSRDQYAKHANTNRTYLNSYDQYLEDFTQMMSVIDNDINRLENDIVNSTPPPICTWAGPQYNNPRPGGNNVNYYRQKVPELNELAALALQGGITRAVTMTLTLGRNHHFQHYIAARDIGRDGVTKSQVDSYGLGLKDYMNQAMTNLNDLVTRLRNKGLFQDTLILVGGEQTDGNTHNANEMPVFIIDGRRNNHNGRIIGASASGQTMPQARPYSDLLVDILRKYGINASNFGSPKNVRGTGNGGIFS